MLLLVLSLQPVSVIEKSKKDRRWYSTNCIFDAVVVGLFYIVLRMAWVRGRTSSEPLCPRPGQSALSPFVVTSRVLEIRKWKTDYNESETLFQLRSKNGTMQQCDVLKTSYKTKPWNRMLMDVIRKI